MATWILNSSGYLLLRLKDEVQNSVIGHILTYLGYGIDKQGVELILHRDWPMIKSSGISKTKGGRISWSC